MTKKKQNSKKSELINAILEEYQPETASDVQDALKDIFGPMFEAMLQGEMANHLGYENNNRRNGYSKKTVRTTNGNISINVPRDREATF
ncbi:transposase-like protein [Paeniclostridium ghonii]|uniref:Mutator family transposase n=1 Tax=Paraclostridium ghonii TaxID=29358 RepID=A0ABU0N062_9FIRM|nr:transposase-like protein [Paeniclostridium ghonii]